MKSLRNPIHSSLMNRTEESEYQEVTEIGEEMGKMSSNWNPFCILDTSSLKVSHSHVLKALV